MRTILQLGGAVQIGGDPAAGVMSGGHHGDRFPDRIHPALSNFRKRGKTLGKIAFHVGVSSRTRGTRAFHLPVNGPGDHIAGSQIRQRMVFLRKGFPLASISSALPANRLGDQKTVTVRRMQGCWMKLHEFRLYDRPGRPWPPSPVAMDGLVV